MKKVIELFDNGKTFKIYYLNKNEKIGKFIEYHKNGIIKIKCNYKNNLLDGRYKKYNFENVLIEDFYYINGYTEGIQQYKLEEKCDLQINSKFDGEKYFSYNYRDIYISPQIIKVYGVFFRINSMTDGKIITYFTDSKLIHDQDDYKNGKRNGNFISYYSNETIHKKFTYVDDYFNGQYIIYNGDGTFAEYTCRDGKIDGVFSVHNNDGKIIYQINYINGIKLSFLLSELEITSKDEYLCGICHTKQNDCLILKCGHIFCIRCLITWLDNIKNVYEEIHKCPYCMTQYKWSDIKKLK